MNEDGKAFELMLRALRSIANNTCCSKCQEAGLVARAALRAIDEERVAPRTAREQWEDELRADEEREIIAEIDAEEELEGWDQSEEDDAELYGLDRESYDSLMHALEKND